MNFLELKSIIFFKDKNLIYNLKLFLELSMARGSLFDKVEAFFDKK